MSMTSETELVALEALAVRVARAAAQFIVAEVPADLRVQTKSSRTDVVTVMDERAQAQIIDGLRQARPQDAIYAEEGGHVQGRSGLTWVVDPIDGTVNYLYGIPAYAVSVAVVEGDPHRDGAWQPLAGAVVNAATGEAFRAHVGGGAFLERPDGSSRRLRVSGSADLGLSLVATGFAYRGEVRARQGNVLADLLPSIRDIRRFGSAALDLTRLASGEVDAYYESGLNSWDYAAGWLVAREAGCVVGGEGHPAGPSSALVWACGPELAGPFGSRINALTARYRNVAEEPARLNP